MITVRADKSALCGVQPIATSPHKSFTRVSTNRISPVAPIADANDVHWYALRTTYTHDQDAYDYLLQHGVEVYMPKMKQVYLRDGKRATKEVNRIPNVFFAHARLHDLEAFVFDNVHLPYLRFYYHTHHVGDVVRREPLVVPDKQMQSFMIVCGTLAPDVLMVPQQVQNFSKGEHVVVTEGDFQGVEGYVARWHGQQRVAVVIENLCTIATAYIPSAFLKKIAD